MSATVRRWCILGPLLAMLLTSPGCAPKVAMSPTRAPVTIKFAYRQHTLDSEQLLQAFHNKYPWITVEVVETERWGDQLGQMIDTAEIDVILDERSALEYAEQGLIRPLDEVQLGDWSGIRNDYFDGAWEGLSVQGQQWGIPAGLDMLTVYVNMDQLVALDLDLPDPNWDLLTFLQLAVKMNFPEGAPYAAEVKTFGFCSDPTGIDPVIFCYLNGGSLVDSLQAPSKATLDSAQTIDAVRWYTDLFTSYQVSPAPEVIRQTYRRGGYYEAAFRGVCGSWIGWYSARGGNDMPNPWSFGWAMLPLPHDEHVFGLGDVQGYYLTTYSKHPREALLFVRWMADQVTASGQLLPPRQSIVKSDEYQELVGKEIAAIANTFSDQVFMIPPDSVGPLQVTAGEFMGGVQQIISENIPAKQVMEGAQQRANLAFR